MRNNYLLALLSAFILWLAWPPIHYTSPLLLIGFFPLLWALENIIRGEFNKKGRKIWMVSFTTAFIWNTASIYWVYNSLTAVMPAYAAIPISLIPFGLSSVLMATVFWIYYQFRKKRGIHLAFLALVCFWIAYEYLHQSWDLAFPWMTLGNGFAEMHYLIQWYEYTGVYGGTIWIWVANIAVFLLILAIKDQFGGHYIKKTSITLGLWIIIPIIFSVVRYNTFEEHINPSQVVVVQPNIDPYGKFDFISPEEQIERLVKLSDAVAQPNTEFFVWPETAIAHSFGYHEEEFRDHPLFDRLQSFLMPYRNGSLVSGIESFAVFPDQHTETAREFGGLYYDHYNAVVLVENSPKLQFYHKSKLVPGVEQLPFASALSFMKPLFSAFGGTTGGYGRQAEPSVLYAQSGIGTAPVVCYESIWGDYVAQYVKQGAQFIAIVTNDGWWGNTSGKDQHFAYAKLRAIETRRWVARAANTGISGFINQRGDIVQRTEWWVEDSRAQEINLNEELTFYVQRGDLVAYIMLGIGSVLLLSLILRIP